MSETATPTVYGIVHMPLVRERLVQDNAQSAKLMNLIFQLQMNPRPDGYQSADEYGPGVATMLCQDTMPPYEIVYSIDEDRQRVTILAISEAQWRI